MKLIKTGSIPKPPLPKWVGKQITCKNCENILELELGDWISVNIDGSGMVICQVCKSGIIMSRKELHGSK